GCTNSPTVPRPGRIRRRCATHASTKASSPTETDPDGGARTFNFGEFVQGADRGLAQTRQKFEDAAPDRRGRRAGPLRTPRKLAPSEQTDRNRVRAGAQRLRL